jgi:GNAT superfamily N-acetyltransferase
LRPKRCNDPRFWIGEATVKQWEFNRFLYQLVGSSWAWTDKSQWSDRQWKEYAESERLKTFVAHYDGSPAGYFELKTGDSEGVEIAIFGLAPKSIGRGFGGVLLTNALEEGWRLKPNRVWLHTCDLDHPAALPNYLARGMTVYKVETRNPRLKRTALFPSAHICPDCRPAGGKKRILLGRNTCYDHRRNHGVQLGNMHDIFGGISANCSGASLLSGLFKIPDCP